MSTDISESERERERERKREREKERERERESGFKTDVKKNTLKLGAN